MQPALSVSASPDKYFNFPPPLHRSVVNSGHSESAVVVQILITIRPIVAINCKKAFHAKKRSLSLPLIDDISI